MSNVSPGSGSGKIIPFAGCFVQHPSNDVKRAFFGIPDDTRSSYLRGCAAGPERIRNAYDGRCFNATAECGVDLTEAVRDRGDIAPEESWQESKTRYRNFVQGLLLEGSVPFMAGGDHAVTIPVVEGLAVLEKPVHVVQIDAHPDLYPQFDGDADSHACVAARMLEMEHVASLTQIGIRTLNQEQSAWLERFKDRVRIHFARDLTGAIPHLSHLSSSDSVYLTLDLDGLDPVYAPGVSHPVPGGLTSRQVLDFIQAGPWQLTGMDVVELNPSRDVNDQTAVLAARLLHEGMAQVDRPTRG